jgi:hypothetical protein
MDNKDNGRDDAAREKDVAAILVISSAEERLWRKDISDVEEALAVARAGLVDFRRMANECDVAVRREMMRSEQRRDLRQLEVNRHKLALARQAIVEQGEGIRNGEGLLEYCRQGLSEAEQRTKLIGELAATEAEMDVVKRELEVEREEMAEFERLYETETAETSDFDEQMRREQEEDHRFQDALVADIESIDDGMARDGRDERGETDREASRGLGGSRR